MDTTQKHFGNATNKQENLGGAIAHKTTDVYCHLKTFFPLLTYPNPFLKANPIPAHNEDQKDTDNPAGSFTNPNMSATVTKIKTEVKEGKKPIPLHPTTLGMTKAAMIASDLLQLTTRGFSELKERGIKPKHFMGDRNKTDHFCYDFGRYLHFKNRFYPKESELVDLFLSLIDHPWADAHSLELEDDHWDDDIPQNKKQCTTFVDIRHRFKQDFGVQGRKGRSQVVLEEISMSGNLAKLENYIAAFELAAPFTGYNGEALLRFFKAGMNPGLCRAVEGMEPEPERLQKFIKAAIHKQNRFEQQQAESKLWRKPRATPIVNVRAVPLAPAPQQTTPSQNPFNGTPVGKLTPEERERCIREGRCFRCRQQGHNTPQCPSNTVPTTQPQVATNNPFRRNQAPAVQATIAPTPSTSTNLSPPAPADDPVTSVTHMTSQLSPEQSTAFFSQFSKTDF
ncbi:hypothetical protein PM082_024501 [Marasmius tenuissimus]|nr:hypothetical protein PM082_024501 [Marasmius tenuissimus]